MNLEETVNRYKTDIIKSVQEIVRIKSVKDLPSMGMPFGQGVNDALLYCLNLASSMGFKTKNLNGYMGYAEYGEGEEILGVLGHLDVVPEGDGWLFPPYDGHIHDNKIYGRGTVDNKGPLICALYGLKALKDSGIILNKKVRIMFGTDEENSWEDIDYYIKNDTLPDLGFTPDGMFPVINVEKGSINLEFSKELIRKSKGMITVKSISGGDAANVVPNLCTCKLKLKDMAKLMLRDTLELYCNTNNINMSIREEGDFDSIISMGLSCHSSTPDKGINAITQLIVFLSQFNLGQNDVFDFIKFLAKCIGNDTSGRYLNIEYCDDLSGCLTINLGQILVDEQKASAVLNIRYPVNSKYEDILENILKAADNRKVKVSILNHKKPLHVDKDSSLVRTLMDCYRNVTKNEPYTIAIGGQTYAKAFHNMVAFGPVFPGREDCAHMSNEHINIEDLLMCTQIYSNAIYELSK